MSANPSVPQEHRPPNQGGLLRRVWFTFALLLPLIAAACGGGTAPAPPSGRALNEMLPQLTTDLTPAGAEQRFGEPDEVTGSGLLIYVYRVENGRSVWLGFPGHAPIAYAKLRERNGGTADLPLRDP